MKLLLVDDEEYVIESIKRNLDLTETGVSEVYTAFSVQQAKNIMGMVDIDIVISDIVMPGGTGFDFVEWVRKEELKVQVIFLTSYAEFDYARRAIQLNSVDYLLKPIDEEKLKEVLKRAENHCKLQKEKEPLIIRVNGENCYVPKEEILYAENYARKVILHLGERQIAYYAKMGELEEQLGESFFRVHRGYLVNLRAVRSYHTAGVVLKNGEEILMAKSKFQKFEEVYMDFLRNSD